MHNTEEIRNTLTRLSAQLEPVLDELEAIEVRRQELRSVQRQIEERMETLRRALERTSGDASPPPTTRGHFWLVAEEAVPKQKSTAAGAAFSREPSETRDLARDNSLEDSPELSVPAARNLSLDEDQEDASAAQATDSDFEDQVKDMFHRQISQGWIFQRCGKAITKGVRTILKLPETTQVDIKVSKLGKDKEFHFNQIRISKAAQVFFAYDENDDRLRVFYLQPDDIRELLTDFGCYTHTTVAKSGSIADRGLDEELVYSLHPCTKEPPVRRTGRNRGTPRPAAKPVLCWRRLKDFEIHANDLAETMISDGHIPASAQ